MVQRIAGCGHSYEAKGAGGRPALFCAVCVPSVCVIDGCEGPASDRRRYMCSVHYEQASAPCSVEGCSKGVRARGLCISHYNKRFGTNRHRKVMVPCAECGVQVEKEAHKNKLYKAQYCSYKCRDAERVRRTQARRAAEKARQLPVRAYPSCEIPWQHPARKLTRLSYWKKTCRVSMVWFAGGRCDWCEAAFLAQWPVGGHLPRFCSAKCAKLSDRASKGRFSVTSVTRWRVYERDGFVCQLCDEPVDVNLPTDDEWAAVLDHVVPRSRGGSDCEENLQLAHRWCNAVLGDKSHYPDDFLKKVS